MEEPHRLHFTDPKGVTNVSPEESVDLDLVAAIRAQYVDELASSSGPRPVEDVHVLNPPDPGDLADSKLQEAEQAPLNGHRPPCLGLGIQPECPPERPRRYARRANGSRVELTERIWGSLIFDQDDRMEVYPSAWPNSVCADWLLKFSTAPGNGHFPVKELDLPSAVE